MSKNLEKFKMRFLPQKVLRNRDLQKSGWLPCVVTVQEEVGTGSQELLFPLFLFESYFYFFKLVGSLKNDILTNFFWFSRHFFHASCFKFVSSL